MKIYDLLATTKNHLVDLREKLNVDACVTDLVELDFYCIVLFFLIYILNHSIPYLKDGIHFTTVL